MDEKLLNIEQAAERLGVEHRMVRRLVDERRIDFVKVGRYVRFTERGLQAWIDANTVRAVSR